MAQVPDIKEFDVQGPLTRIGQNIQQTLATDIPNMALKGVDTYMGLQEEGRKQGKYDEDMKAIAEKRADLETIKRAANESIDRVAASTGLNAKDLLAVKNVINNSTDPSRISGVVINLAKYADHMKQSADNGVDPVNIDVGTLITKPIESFAADLDGIYKTGHDSSLRGATQSALNSFMEEKKLSTLQNVPTQDFMAWLGGKYKDPQMARVMEYVNGPGKQFMDQSFQDPSIKKAQIDAASASNVARISAGARMDIAENTRDMTNMKYLETMVKSLTAETPAGFMHSPDVKTKIDDTRKMITLAETLANKANIPDPDSRAIAQTVLTAIANGDPTQISRELAAKIASVDKSTFDAMNAAFAGKMVNGKIPYGGAPQEAVVPQHKVSPKVPDRRVSGRTGIDFGASVRTPSLEEFNSALSNTQANVDVEKLVGESLSRAVGSPSKSAPPPKLRQR